MSKQPKRYKITQEALSDFSATIEAKPELSKQEIHQKFPEFQNNDEILQSAMDYHATVKSKKYKTTEEINAKFPEFDFTESDQQSQKKSGGQVLENGFPGFDKFLSDQQKPEREKRYEEATGGKKINFGVDDKVANAFDVSIKGKKYKTTIDQATQQLNTDVENFSKERLTEYQKLADGLFLSSFCKVNRHTAPA